MYWGQIKRCATKRQLKLSIFGIVVGISCNNTNIERENAPYPPPPQKKKLFSKQNKCGMGSSPQPIGVESPSHLKKM